MGGRTPGQGSPPRPGPPGCHGDGLLRPPSRSLGRRPGPEPAGGAGRRHARRPTSHVQARPAASPATWSERGGFESFSRGTVSGKRPTWSHPCEVRSTTAVEWTRGCSITPGAGPGPRRFDPVRRRFFIRPASQRRVGTGLLTGIPDECPSGHHLLRRFHLARCGEPPPPPASTLALVDHDPYVAAQTGRGAVFTRQR